METCSVDGCAKPGGARGWCHMHYMRWYKHGDVNWQPPKGRKPCIVDGCTRARERRGGYCHTHFNRLQKTGDPLVVGLMPRGAEHPRWKGGRRVTSDGYVVLSEPGNSATRVLEHRAVMERKLGRPLLPGENVHHINGVRDDNRPENLELWVTHQPKGQRPADLVEWAEEVLRRYGDGRPDQDRGPE